MSASRESGCVCVCVCAWWHSFSSCLSVTQKMRWLHPWPSLTFYLIRRTEKRASPSPFGRVDEMVKRNKTLHWTELHPCVVMGIVLTFLLENKKPQILKQIFLSLLLGENNDNLTCKLILYLKAVMNLLFVSMFLLVFKKEKCQREAANNESSLWLSWDF